MTDEDLSVASGVGSGDMVLYPNPANDKILVNTTSAIDHITISNMLGQVVSESNGENYQINTANYSTGFYSIILRTDKGNWFGKFIKE